MKPKYYPHVTILGAATIIMAPLVLVLSLTHFRDNSEFEVAINTDNTNVEPARSASDAETDVKMAMASLDQQQAHQKASGRTRVAMRDDTGTTTQALADRPPEVVASAPPSLPQPAFHTPHASAILDQIKAGKVDVVQTHPILVEEVVPVPLDIATEKLSTPAATTSRVSGYRSGARQELRPTTENAAESLDDFRYDRVSGQPASVESPVAQTPTAAAQTKPKVDPQREALDAEMDVVLAQKTTTQGRSHFDSTGHLSMASPQHAAIAGTSTVDAADTTPSRSKRRSAALPRTSSKTTVDVEPASAGAWPVDDDGFGAPAEVVYEDIILQQPLESRRVDRVEPVVAVTRAKGWPIALVRSDLPDDHWWVQQMVGTRGNAFAARVNFGNDESLPGSVYHLVIVFLDSPDEVRRFRIAKRFKDLPEGARRTREFTFVRR